MSVSFLRITPVLMYQDITAAHDFLVQAFGFVSGGIHRTPEGHAVHGEVRAGDAAIWLHHVTAEHHLDSPLALDVANSGLFVHVDDVDAHDERARAAGARIDSEPSRSAVWSARIWRARSRRPQVVVCGAGEPSVRGRITMNIRRVVPDISSDDLVESREFYAGFLGFQVVMDMGWVITFASKSNPTAQVTVMRGAPSGGVQPNMSIEVDDVDHAYRLAIKRKFTIVYPLVDEPWGVRRFFVADPTGVVINVLSHTARHSRTGKAPPPRSLAKRKVKSRKRSGATRG